MKVKKRNNKWKENCKQKEIKYKGDKTKSEIKK